MELISTHFIKAANVGYHGNLFGGTMLAWLDEAGVSFAAQVCDTPRMVTKKISEVVFHKPVKPGQIISVVIPSINPRQGIYEWSSSFYPESPTLPPSQSLGPVLRLDIYRLNNKF